jgi:hypothetical protein
LNDSFLFEKSKMEFCSKYGYDYGDKGSDEEEYYEDDRKKKIRQVNTNIIAVKFDKLIAMNLCFAGEPKSCQKCGAIISYLSGDNIIKHEDKLIWTCEFCMNLNDITSLVDDLNEIPKEEDVTFLLKLPIENPTEDTNIKEVSDNDRNINF